MADIVNDKNFLTDSVLILERINAKISKIENLDDPDAYIFEGIFAEFDGQKNENGRIYKVEDYLPHLKYLNESIKAGNLVGEIDHPEKLEPSLKNASHIIESLEYNSSTKQIIGKIRLLTTPAGEIARKLANDRVALSISSRAVGRVREDKTVDLQKIITFDLVAQPGFKNARLNRINESLGILDEDIAIYDLSGEEKQSMLISTPNNENKKFENSMINNDINKLRESYNELMEQFSEKEKELAIIKESYTKSEERITALEEYMNKLSEKNIQNSDKIEESSALTELKEQFETLSEFVNGALRDGVNLSESRIEELSKTISNQLTPTLESLGGYMDGEINETFDVLKGEVAILKEFLTDFTNKYGEQLKKLQPYMDYITATIKESVSNLEYATSDVIDNVSKLEEGIKEEIGILVEHVNMSNATINTFMNYQTEVNEGFEKSNSTKIDESLNESKNVDSQKDYIKDKEDRISDYKETFNKILESVTIKKQNVVEESNVSAYLSHLSNENRNKFLLLDGDAKTKITKSILELKPVNEAQIMSIWERAIAPLTEWDKNEDLLRFLPKNLRPAFDKLEEGLKTKIFEESKLWDLSNDRMKTNFWLARKSLFENIFENVDYTTINSNNTTEEVTSEFKNDYMKMIAKKLDSFGK